MPVGFQQLPAANSAPHASSAVEILSQEWAGAVSPVRGRRQRLAAAAAGTATKLLPLVALLDAIQPQLTQESVFRVRRKKIKAHLAAAYAELHAERPRHQALAHAFQALAEVVREEAQDIGPEEWKQAAKEVVLATLKNAPGLINAAHQARLLS